jgi:hypothetical protein
MDKNAVRVLFPTLMQKRKELHKKARARRVQRYADMFKKQLQEHPLFGL